MKSKRKRNSLEVRRRDKYGEKIRRILYPPHDIEAQWEWDTADRVTEVLDEYISGREPGERVMLYHEMLDAQREWEDDENTTNADLVEDYATLFGSYQPEYPYDYWEEIWYIFNPIVRYDASLGLKRAPHPH